MSGPILSIEIEKIADGAQPARMLEQAVLDMTSDENIISKRVVEEDLGFRGNPTPHGEKSNQKDTQGYIELSWCLYKSNRTFKARFEITREWDPPFEVMLGRRTIEENRIEV